MTENSKSKFDIASENLIFDFLAINAFEDTYIDQEVNERFLVHQYDNDKFSWQLSIHTTLKFLLY